MKKSPTNDGEAIARLQALANDWTTADSDYEAASNALRGLPMEIRKNIAIDTMWEVATDPNVKIEDLIELYSKAGLLRKGRKVTDLVAERERLIDAANKAHRRRDSIEEEGRKIVERLGTERDEILDSARNDFIAKAVSVLLPICGNQDEADDIAICLSRSRALAQRIGEWRRGYGFVSNVRNIIDELQRPLN